jgi:hypothetical protein
VGAGVTFRHLNDIGQVPAFLFSTGGSANSVGFVAAGGVRFTMGPVNITPELRYVRWNAGSFARSFLNLLSLSRHEASVLLGLTF